MKEENTGDVPKNLPILYPCPIMTTLRVMGGKWKPAILWELHQHRVARFGELRKRIPDINHKMLAQQLRELENDGLIHRKVYAQVPPKVEYRLSTHGQSLHAVLYEMSVWGMNYPDP